MAVGRTTARTLRYLERMGAELVVVVRSLAPRPAGEPASWM